MSPFTLCFRNASCQRSWQVDSIVASFLLPYFNSECRILTIPSVLINTVREAGHHSAHPVHASAHHVHSAAVHSYKEAGLAESDLSGQCIRFFAVFADPSTIYQVLHVMGRSKRETQGNYETIKVHTDFKPNNVNGTFEKTNLKMSPHHCPRSRPSFYLRKKQ